MTALGEVIRGLPEVAQLLMAISAIAVTGLAIGRLSWGGFGLGIGGVLFGGLIVGHLAGQLGIRPDPHTLHFVREFGLILFVYAVGIQVGPGFVASLRAGGLVLNLLAVLQVALGVGVAVALVLAVGLPLPVVLGLFAGGSTNTPALGAAQQVLADAGVSGAALAEPGLAYAAAYPFGVIGLLLAMLVLRALLRETPEHAAAAFEAQRRAAIEPIQVLDLVLRAGAQVAEGTRLSALSCLRPGAVQATRLLRDGEARVATDALALRPGDVLRLVGTASALDEARRQLGEPASAGQSAALAGSLVLRQVTVTRPALLGAPVPSLQGDAGGPQALPATLQAATGPVRVTRVRRAGVELVPDPHLRLRFGDVLTVVGQAEDVAALAKRCGNSAKRLTETDLLPVFLGILTGLVLGLLPLSLPGLPLPLKLGLAGGPLVAAILLSRLGNLGPVVWFLPPAAGQVLRETGIVLFLAAVGFMAGDRFLATLLDGDGLFWMACGAMVTIIPVAVVATLAHLVCRLNYLTICGLVAGGMTDPPALAFANAMAPSDAPALAYATVYPLVMCLRILSPQLLAIALLA